MFPQCKWDCKWCWWMSCRWSFEGSLARNAFLRDSRCTKPYVFPDKVRPRTSMIYLCGATGARRSRVWSDHSRIMVGSVSDRFRIVNGVSTVFRPCAVDRISLWFATVGSFPQCKWDCKWCWWMSCRWSFEGSLARNEFLREQMHETLCFSRQSASPNVDARNPMFFSILALVIFQLDLVNRLGVAAWRLRNGFVSRFAPFWR